MTTLPTLSIVVPCYNEEDVFTACNNELTKILQLLASKNKISSKSHILYVDDGSHDQTWHLIEMTAAHNPAVKGIKLSCNKGHQTALMAGLESCNQSDITISIDADLQDDTSVIETMVDKYHSGYDVVFGVRNERKTDTIFKRMTAESFYKLMTFMKIKQVENHADFRLLSQKALSALMQYKEQNMYIRGLVPLIGFKTDNVFYARKERLAGESKYPLKKMLGLAVDGITSLSVTPLRLVTLLGFSISFITTLIIFYSLVIYILGYTIQGWTSIILAVMFIGGVQMLCLGIIGEYIGKIYIETKNRPKFFIEKKTPEI